MSDEPLFHPEPAPTGALLLFVRLPALEGPGTCIAHSEDFDDLLGMIPEGVDWHIFSRPIDRLVGGNGAGDRDFGAVEAIHEDDDSKQFIHFVKRSDGAWGAYEIVGYAGKGADDVLWLDTETSTRNDGTVIPSFDAIEGYQDEIAAWQLQQIAKGKAEPSSELNLDAMGESSLPSQWKNLSNEELRAAVEQAEAEAGVTPEQAAAVRALAEEHVARELGD